MDLAEVGNRPGLLGRERERGALRQRARVEVAARRRGDRVGGRVVVRPGDLLADLRLDRVRGEGEALDRDRVAAGGGRLRRGGGRRGGCGGRGGRGVLGAAARG